MTKPTDGAGESDLTRELELGGHVDAAEEDPTVPSGTATDGVPTGDDASVARLAEEREEDPPDEVEVGLGPTD